MSPDDRHPPLVPVVGYVDGDGEIVLTHPLSRPDSLPFRAHGVRDSSHDDA